MSGIKIETYFFDGTEQHNDNKKLILVIYDIVSDKRRTKFVKFVEKYGFRVQKSAFEMILDSSKYNQLIAEIPRHITDEDNVRVYRLPVAGDVSTFGNNITEKEEVIII